VGYTIRPAVRSNVTLLIGLAGASGSGKTYSALRLASGMAQGKRFIVIDTENGRASHYADQFEFDVLELHEPFAPAAYAAAIKQADEAGYPVIVIDSASHEYAGSGGVLDMQEAEFERMGYRDSAKVASWIKPKGEHKKMMQRLLQTRAHMILCLRAEAKIEIVQVVEDGKKKTKIVPKQSLVGLDGWIPVTEKTVPFELTVSLMLTPDKPGIPQPIKLQQQHKALFPLDKEITEESGRLIAEWASGGAAPAAPETPRPSTSPNVALITPDQHTFISDKFRDNQISVETFLEKAKIKSLIWIPAADYQRTLKYIDDVLEARRKKLAQES